MALNLTRMTAYAIISALEEDLRALIKEYMGSDSGAVLDEELLKRSKKRLEKDFGMEMDDLYIGDYIDYFDIGDTYQVINANSGKFPSEIYANIKKFTKKFEEIVPIRNRIMHIRPLNYNDLPSIIALCEQLIAAAASMWKKVKLTLDKINFDSSFVLGVEIKNLDDVSFVKHNLPLPDFDETGLIGRDEDVIRIKKLINGSFPVISIVGEGGVGKTALALKVAYELIEEEKSHFDAIVWVSSKTTQITLSEIKDIKGAIKDSFGVLQEISNQLEISESKHVDLDEIIEYLSKFKIALFIDNLETIIDDNIRNFIGSLPLGSKIIITSRIGLGAFEYPIKLQGISESYATKLLRELSKLRGVGSLSKLDEKILIGYVNRMHRNPSYIKWFVSSVQTGVTPEGILQNSGLFLEFCMSNVYNYLSKDAKYLTSAFQCAPGLKDMPELSYLVDFDSLKIQKSIQELMKTNMLVQISKAKGSSIKNAYELSELARSYLSKHHRPTSTLQNKIKEKRNKLNSLAEQQMAMKGNRYSNKNIIFRDKGDRVIAHKLLQALNFIRKENNRDAYDILEEAQRLSPDYFEVARVMAYFYQNNGNISGAREQYELALVLAPDTPQLHFWYAEFLRDIEENIDESAGYFKKALDIDKNSTVVALSLARVYMFQHDFENSRKILNSIKDTIGGNEVQYKTYLDTDIQIYYRIADDLTRSGRYVEAFEAFLDMRRSFDSLDFEYKDSHIRRKLSKCEITINIIAKNIDKSYSESVDGFKLWLGENKI